MGSPNLIDPAELAAARRLAGSPRAREIRERAGLSQSDIGAGIGRSGATVQRWEAGLRRPSRDVALRYAAVLAALAKQIGESETPPTSDAPAGNQGVAITSGKALADALSRF